MIRLQLADLGAPIATGRTSEIYPLPGSVDRVVKLFLASIPEATSEAEAECEKTGLAAQAALTTVHCHGTVSVGDRAGLILDRMEGISLTSVAERNPLLIRRTARTLADLQIRMHEVAVPDLPEVRQVVLDTLGQPPLAFLSADELLAAKALVNALPEGDQLLHLDFHPENVFSTTDGYQIIDWQTALRGVPAADVAASVFLLNDAELWPGTPAVKKVLLSLVRRTYFSAYIDEYRRRTGLADTEIAKWRLPALVLRLGWDIASEREQLRTGVREALAQASR